MQLISNPFRGWADAGCSSPVSLHSPRVPYKFTPKDILPSGCL